MIPTTASLGSPTIARRARSLALLFWAVGCSLSGVGCTLFTPSETTRFFQIDHPEPIAASDANRSQPLIGIHPVRLPAYLDRMSMVVAVTPVRYEILPLEQWAGALREGLQLALLAHISRLLDNPNVVLLPQSLYPIDRTVHVDILRLDGNAGKPVTLSAQWVILGDRQPLSRGSFSQRRVAGSDLDGLVRSLGELVGDLAAEIAEGLR